MHPYLNGATPYSLVYGEEAVLHVEMEIPFSRVLMEIELEEAERVHSRYDQLNFAEEKRFMILCHGQCYQKRIAQSYNKKVKPRSFNKGDLVLE